MTHSIIRELQILGFTHESGEATVSRFRYASLISKALCDILFVPGTKNMLASARNLPVRNKGIIPGDKLGQCHKIFGTPHVSELRLLSRLV